MLASLLWFFCACVNLILYCNVTMKIKACILLLFVGCPDAATFAACAYYIYYVYLFVIIKNRKL